MIEKMSEYAARGEQPEIVFWVGCFGSFDSRAQKVTHTFIEILNKAGVKFAILGNEETCTGDPARRAGNEFLFQMSALQNIATFDAYGVKRIVTACPHCFNTIKNEYPDLGGNYEVIHHTQLLNDLIKENRIQIQGGSFQGKKITYHDSCYLGRINDIYEVPREVLKALDIDLLELKRSRANGLCCGAGGAQMFKEDEPGRKRINLERADEILETGAESVVANCPYCITMLNNGMKAR